MTGSRGLRRPLIIAGIAVVAALALLGGPGTLAFFSDAESAPKTTIQAAPGISATAAASVESRALPGAPGSVVAAPGDGLVPGVRSLNYRFTVTIGAGTPVQSYLSGTVSASGTAQGSEIYNRGFLLLASSASTGCVIGQNPAIVDGRLQTTIATAPGHTLKPGESCTFDISASIPATVNGLDLARELRGLRASTVGSFDLNATLTQVPRAEERP
ncbi:SipW-dependent-type signal peptide-containing protein [Mycetocola spongiae]|uniref:SipW-dependent-type signal peptide-containing protein n=1 Tax=Mycetocola spongiae TaxID=2859226 RepID=UPI001CF21F82|nr:SipW-dependent-type signal peptide-containing protein [Mycetocola spongiae]UCR88405.1 SipW-dependent-type signal peptide-containing protein [Mycetocola spongiae]